MFDLETLNYIFFQRFIITLILLFILIQFGIGKKTNFSDSSFVYYMFGIGVFLVTYAMQKIEISLGFAFGLFAIFSMLRYRTEVLSFKEMTYLFLVIVVSLLCSVSPLSNFELMIVGIIVGACSHVVELPFLKRNEKAQFIRYEKIDNIKPENYSILLNDLKNRTGLNIIDVIIESIDFMQDCAKIKIIYIPNQSNIQ